MLTNKPISFSELMFWVNQDKENRILLWSYLITSVIIFLVFKIMYPYPNFMPPDSYSYLEAAFFNQTINTWAIGYSKFLRLFSSLSNSHFVLVFFQFTFLTISIVYFLFSIKYFLSIGKWSFRVLVAINLFNPLIPHISNFISSDALFTSLSILWFTQLLWILHHSNKKLLFSHGIVLLFVFMVRHNALYYPLISIVVIALTKIPLKIKTLAIGFTLFLLGSFIGRTMYQYYVATRTLQYSAFGGWQIASNALYGYAYDKSQPAAEVPNEFRKLHSLVNTHMDSVRKLKVRPDSEVAIYYLWDLKSPLRVYMDQYGKEDSSKIYFKKWASVAPLYSTYGMYLIKHHPGNYIKHYLWPNLIKFYVPPVGFLGYYNMQKDTIDQIASLWFGLKQNTIKTRFNNSKIVSSEVVAYLFPMINLAFIVAWITYLMMGGLRLLKPALKYIILLSGSFWALNLFFSVFAAPIELRYQLAPGIITFSFLIYLISFLINKSFE